MPPGSALGVCLLFALLCGSLMSLIFFNESTYNLNDLVSVLSRYVDPIIMPEKASTSLILEVLSRRSKLWISPSSLGNSLIGRPRFPFYYCLVLEIT